jgi:hypothetical protein
MRKTTIAFLSVVFGVAGTGVARATPFTLMYGGNGGLNNGTSVNDGSLILINETTAAVTLVGHPDGVARLSGLAFDSTGTLWGSTLSPSFPAPPPPSPTTSSLIQIDPTTGAQFSSVPITFGGRGISIADLAVQPGTDTLFGVTGPNGPGPARLLTINRSTGAAALVGLVGGASPESFASIGFAPSGTLYASVASFANGPIRPLLVTLNPLTGAILTSVATADFFGAFGIRPDGVIFAGTGDTGDLFTVNPLTGAETLVGSTGLNFVGDLDFRVVPEPTTMVLLGSGLVATAIRRRRSRVR